MTRYAREFLESHESPRLAAAILAHLKSLANELPTRRRLAETIEHWIKVWGRIPDQHVRSGTTRHAAIGGHFWITAVGTSWQFVGDVRESTNPKLRTFFKAL